MKKNLLISFIFFFVFWFGFLGLSGTLTSGFHLTDDHQIFYFAETIKNNGAIKTGVEWIGLDMGRYGRFLPVYYLHRVLEIKFFGADFLVWGLYNGLLTALASFLFSAAFLVLGFTLFEALVFPLFLYLGFQSAVMWRFGTAETIGLPVLSVMFLMAALGARERSLWKDALFTIAGAVMILTKESFLAFIPAALFLKVWLEKKHGQKGWVETARQNAFPIVALLASVGAMVLLIKLYMQSSGIGYAGYYGFQTGPFQGALKNYLRASEAWLIPAGLALAWATGKGKKLSTEAVPLLIFVGLVLIPQALLHSRSGVYERYILPGAFATVFAAVYLLKVVRENIEGNERQGRYVALVLAALFVFVGAHFMRKNGGVFLEYNAATLGWTSPEALTSAISSLHGNWAVGLSQAAILMLFSVAAVRPRFLGLWQMNQRAVFALLLGWAVMFNFSIAFDNASRSAFEGRMTNEWLASIKENTEKDGAIVVVADPALNFEWVFSMKRYLNIEAGRTNIFTYPVVTKDDYAPFLKELIQKFSGLYKDFLFTGQKDFKGVQAISIFPGAEKRFLEETAPWFDKGSFVRYENGYGYVSYYRAGERKTAPPGLSAALSNP